MKRFLKRFFVFLFVIVMLFTSTITTETLGIIASAADTQGPVFSEVKVAIMAENGYTVTAKVSDNVGVTRVLFPTWISGQSGGDAIWLAGTYDPTYDHWACWVPVSNWNNHYGTYYTHVYAYDSAGNNTGYGALGDIRVPSLNGNSEELASSGTYNLANNSTIRAKGWLYNRNGDNVKVHYRFDNGIWYTFNLVDRTDVPGVYPDCKQVKCGYNQNISIANLAAGQHTIDIIAETDGMTKVIYSKTFTVVRPESYVYFDVNDGGGKNLNLLAPQKATKTTSGVTYSFDGATGIITLNGSASANVDFFSKPFKPTSGEIYKLTATYVSGSLSNGCVVLEARDNDGNRMNFDVLNSSTSKTWTITSTQAQKINRIDFWGWCNSSAGKLTFNNYKIKLKLEKVSSSSASSTSYTPNAKYLAYGQVYNTMPVVTRTGYTLNGWYTAKSGGTKITAGTTVTIGSAQTLYAQWTANTYYVKYNGNGNTGGSMSNSTHTYDTAKNLTANSFTRTGYTFNGWNTKADGTGTSYTNSASVKNLSSTNGATVNLYAQWTPNKYTIKFYGNGSTAGSMSDVACTYDVSKTLPTNLFSRTYYVFNGWNTKQDGSGTNYSDGSSVKNLVTTNNGSVSLYAQWILDEYLVCYDANGGSGAPVSQNKTATIGLTLTEDIPTTAKKRTMIFDSNGGSIIDDISVDCAFREWNTVSDGSGTAYSSGDTYLTEADVVLYAQWDNPVAGTLPIPTKSGYTFKGWIDAENNKLTSETILNNDIVVTAQWEANDYVVTFNTNGGSCDTSNKTATYDSTYGSLPIPTRTGYYFAGWFDSLTGGEKVTENTVVSDVSDHMLYAHWEEKHVTGISVNLTKTKTTHYVGDSFTPSEVVLTVTCEDGEVFDITKGFECSTPTLDKMCKKRVTVKYKDLTAYYTIDVVMAPLQSISVKNHPDNLAYTLGDSVNTNGLILQATYANGYSAEVTTGYKTAYDFSTSGNKTVVVSYTESNITKTAAYSVTVEDVPQISSDVTSAHCGEIVSVPVYISNNKGIMGFGIEVSYDENALTPISVTAGAGFNGFFDDSISTADTNNFMVYWTGSENVSNDGIIFTIDFLVADNAYGETIIGLNYSSDDTFDEDWNDVKLVCNNITLNISEKDSNVTKIIADNCSVKSGEYIDIPIKIVQNKSLSASTISVGYDSSVLTPVLVVGDLATVSQTNIETCDGSLDIVIDEVAQSLGDGTLLTVRFFVEYCDLGEYDITINCSDSNIKSENFKIDILPGATKIYGGDIVIDGDIITVPVNISGNYGIMGLRLNFTYDASVMEPVSATPGKVITSGMTEDTIGVSPAGTLSFIWIGNDDITDNGELLLLKFKMLSGTKGSKISVNYSVPDTYNSSWENVDLDCEDITVSYEIAPKENTFIDFVNKFIFTKGEEKSSILDFFNPSADCEFVGTASHISGTTQFFGTGSLIYVYNNGAPQYPFTLVVEGDVNGDSVCDALDAAQVANASNGLQSLDGAYAMAADSNSDDEISIEDYQAIVNKAVS